MEKKSIKYISQCKKKSLKGKTEDSFADIEIARWLVQNLNESCACWHKFNRQCFFMIKDDTDYSSPTRPHNNGTNLSLWHLLVWFWVDPSHLTYTPLWQTHSAEVTYVGRSTATQPSDSINEVLLHLSAETHTGHQLLQQLAVLHLKGGRQHVGNAIGELVKETYTSLTHS